MHFMNKFLIAFLLIAAAVAVSADDRRDNLKQIGAAVAMYSMDHDDAMPPDLTALVSGKYLTDMKCFVSPLDTKRRPAADGRLVANSCSYVYIKGLKAQHKQYPLAFEKADVVAGRGDCAVLFVSGEVKIVKVNGTTDREIAAELIQAAKGSAGGRKPAARAVSAAERCNNLKQIGTAALMYSMDHDDAMPPDLNALVSGKYLTETTCYISPLDTKRRPSTNGQLGANNCSYIYVKGLKAQHKQYPLAFEKADVVAGRGDCAVLFVSGVVRIVKVNGTTDREIAAELIQAAKRSAGK